MYYEEKIIDNKLCFRILPNHIEWKEYSKEALTDIILYQKEVIKELEK